MNNKKFKQTTFKFPLPDPIEKICNVLETTPLLYAEGVLHEHITEQVKKQNPKKVAGYCAMGIAARYADIPESELEGEGFIDNIYPKLMGRTTKHRKRLLELIMTRYGIDVTQKYSKTNTSKMRCPLGCDDQWDALIEDQITLEDVISHINDAHSKSHKQTAGLIREFSRYYNLVTGEKLT